MSLTNDRSCRAWRLIFVLLTLWFHSCSECREDANFKDKFQECLDVADLINGKGYYTDFKTRCNTFECLIAITGFEGHVDFGSSFHGSYPCRELLDQDLDTWTKWYEDNKCSFTLERADSLIRLRAILRDIPDLAWPVRDSLKQDDF